MFSKKRHIIYFQENILTIFDVTIGKKPVVKKLIEYEWKPDTLTVILKKVKKRIGKKVWVLLSDQFVYTANIHLPAKMKNSEYEYVHQHVQELIPEDMVKTSWDYKVILEIKKPDQKESDRVAQVIVLVQSMFELLQIAFTRIKFQIEGMEAVSQSLTRLIHDSNSTILLVYLQKRSLFVLFHKGLIVSTYTHDQIVTSDSVKRVIDFNSEKYNITPNKIIFSGDQLTFDTKQFITTERIVAQETLDPAVGIALKSIKKGDTKQVLNLTLDRLVSSTEVVDKNEKKGVQPTSAGNTNQDTASNSENAHEIEQASQKRTLLGIVILIISILATVGIFIYQNDQNSELEKKKKAANISPTIAKPQTVMSTVSPTKAATSSAQVVLSIFPMTIYNGSGREGEAGKLQSTLQEKGFSVETVANAANSDYQQTEIQYKKNVTEEFKVALEKIIKTYYPTKIGEALADDSATDVVVTIGQQVTEN